MFNLEKPTIMKTVKDGYEDRKIEELLNPKYTPECRIIFATTPRGRIKNIRRYVRFGGVAAAIVIVAAIGIKSLFMEEIKAMPSPLASVEKALQEFGNLQSICVKFKLKNPLSDYGYPTKDYEQTGGYTSGTLYYLQQEEKGYMRIEWNDERKTTHISDGENETLMQGQDSLGEIVTKKARPLPDIIKFTDKKSIMEIKPEQIKTMTVFKSTGKIIIELLVPKRKGKFVLTFVAVPGKKGGTMKNVTEKIDKEEQNLLLVKASIIMGSDETEEVIFETESIEYNYPITKEQILNTSRLK